MPKRESFGTRTYWYFSAVLSFPSLIGYLESVTQCGNLMYSET